MHCWMQPFNYTQNSHIAGHVFVWASFLVLIRRTHSWCLSKHFRLFTNKKRSFDKSKRPLVTINVNSDNSSVQNKCINVWYILNQKVNLCSVATLNSGNAGQYLISSFEVRRPRCVGSITKNFSCITLTVEHNYISSSSTVGIQLHVSALYVSHLQVVI